MTEGTLDVEKISTEDQLADINTKALRGPWLKNLTHILDLQEKVQ